MDAETKLLLKIIKKSEKLLRDLKTLRQFGEEVETLKGLKLKLEKNLINRIGEKIESNFEEEAS